MYTMKRTDHVGIWIQVSLCSWLTCFPGFFVRDYNQHSKLELLSTSPCSNFFESQILLLSLIERRKIQLSLKSFLLFNCFFPFFSVTYKLCLHRKRTSFDDGQLTAGILSYEILSGETQLSNNGYWASEINNW